MPLDTLWRIYRAQGYAAAIEALPSSDALDHFYLALLAFGNDDFARAAAFARQAADRQPESRVYTQAAAYLDRAVTDGKAGVYVDGEAFAAFIRGGGNVGLYAAASKGLRAVYSQYPTLRLLDIGVGDGLALLPALTDNLAQIDLIEPSAAMLQRTIAALETRGVPCHAANTTLQDFMKTHQGQTWDIIQATWSLQSIPPAERPVAFEWMAAHTDRLLIAEFDVPDFPDLLAPARVRYVLDRYERGLAEYDSDGSQVAQGFLMPVMFGYFDRGAARTNWEGPIAGWVDELYRAGFRNVQASHLYAYFWADAYLIDAQKRDRLLDAKLLSGYSSG